VNPRWLDGAARLAEIGARQLYWRSPWLRERAQAVRAPRRTSAHADRDAVVERLEAAGVREGALVMIHASLDGLEMGAPTLPGGVPLTGSPLAAALLDDLQSLIGARGTLAMPTHPAYRQDPGFMHDKRDLVLSYDPGRTPSKVGLMSELFRRSPGVERSLHPLSSLAARGPEAAGLLRDNLNEQRPLPHGVHSGYYRFCEAGGTVVSINIPLIKAISIAHTPEEVRDGDWEVPDFFYPRRFRVRVPEGEQEWTVRERHPVWVRNICLGQLRRDLLREGIMREGSVGTMRMDSANAGAIYEYMTWRHERSPYPYFGIRRRTRIRKGIR
jgi:aminoglycoside 3-N-acetyltransferase